MVRRYLLSTLTLTALAAVPMQAQGTPARPAARPAVKSAPPMAAVDSALFRGLRYRLVGPSRGGRVTTVTGVPSQPRTFYMGVASGGVFRTTDGGESWAPLTDGKVPLGSVGSIAVAESNPDIIYVGTGSDGVRSNVSTGRGVYKTSDGGKTWEFAGLYNAGQIGAVRIHPSDPNTVWVAAYGDIFKPSRERGVFKTTDGGKSWKQTLSVSDSTGAMDVELQPGNPAVVYAWLSRIERKPWTIISGSREGGFYKSGDGGDTWARVTTGLPGELIGKANLAVTAANPNRIYALIEAKPGAGLYRSDDAGQTWAQVNAQPALVQRPFYYTTLGADPTNADVVYAGAEGFFKSSDGGRTMTPMRTPHGDNHDIWVNPRDGNTLIQSNDGGANVSFDGGRTWSTQMNQPTSEIYGVWMDNAFPYRLYGAQQDNTTLIISSVASPYNLADWRTGPGCETGPIMPHPTDPNIVYGSCKGQYEVMSLATGQSKRYWVGGQSLYGNPGKDLIYRFQRVSPMATSPHDPAVLYYGSQYLHRTRDKGVTWEKISPDLTANPACCQGASGEPITRDVTGEEFYSTLYAITESPHEAGVIWTGANDGPFHLSRDNGKTWKNVTPKDLPTGGRVAWIEASPHRRGSAYFAVYRYLLGDYQPYLYRTDDYGTSWKRLTDGKNGIPADWPTRVVREDPDREGLLYAGTEFGMFISFDNGAHWQPFQLNLPNVPINDLRVYHNDLIVATQGRALWILDDLASLHQITPQTSASAVQLYRPRDGFRTRNGAELLSPTIEYYLPSVPEGAVKLEILDAAGKAVNAYSSDTPAPPARAGRGGGDPDDPDAPGFGRFVAVTTRVTKETGLNRAVWDLRHSSGVTAPPGSYQARLTVSGKTMTQPFTLRIDPRLAADGTTAADLREQFEHNLRMRDLVTAVNQVVTRVRAAQTRLQSAGPAAADTLARVQAIAARLITEPVRYAKPGLQAHITYLNGMTGAVDQKIGRDAIARYQTLKTELDAIKAELDRLLGELRTMTTDAGLITHVSDTARWVAVYRAMESERPDAIFRDPYARRLAGERGEAIVRAMPKGRKMAWPMIVRTALMDEIVGRLIMRDGVDCVLNLAAGLDARPWRMDLPHTLKWIDVDHPDMIAYKVATLAGEKTKCQYEAVPLDLAEAAGRRALFQRVAAGARRVLVMTEGLLVYLPPPAVAELAKDLAAQPSFRYWLMDLASPGLLKMLERTWAPTLRAGNAPMQFGPAENTAYFAPYGWRELEYRSMFDESLRLNRSMPMARFWKFIGRFFPRKKQAEFARFSGVALLERE